MSTSRPNDDVCELHTPEESCDIMVKVENRTFPCHRKLLALYIEYFRSMFSGNDDEAKQEEVEIKGVKAADFELLLTHIYGGSVDLKENNVYRLLRISHHVGLETLSNICEEYIINNKEIISLDIILDVFVFACKLERTVLADELAKPLAKNFLSVFKEEQLFSISRTQVERIFSHLDLVENRMSVLDFMDFWSGFHPTDVDVFHSWLMKLNLPSDLCERTKDKLNKKKMSSFDKCETSKIDVGDTLDTKKERVFYYECIVDQFSEVQLSSKISLYCLHRQEIGCYRYDFDAKSNRIRVDETDPWYPKSHSNHLKFFKSVRTENTHILFGGRTAKLACKITPYLYNYNSSSTGKCLADYCSKRIYSPEHIAICGSDVYLYNNGEFLLFSAELNRWTHLKEYEPPITKNASLISYQNNLYKLGGECIGSGHETVGPPNKLGKFQILNNGKLFLRYDPRVGNWSQLPYMDHSNIRPSSCVYNDILYVSGMEDGLVQCFDFAASKWRTVAKGVPKPNQTHSVIGYDDRLYFFFGIDDLTWYSYDLKEDVWSDVLRPQKRGPVQISKIWDAEVKVL